MLLVYVGYVKRSDQIKIFNLRGKLSHSKQSKIKLHYVQEKVNWCVVQ